MEEKICAVYRRKSLFFVTHYGIIYTMEEIEMKLMVIDGNSIINRSFYPTHGEKTPTDGVGRG